MIVKQDKVILNSVYKAIIYDKLGKMRKEAKFTKHMLSEAFPIGENFIATKFKWVDATLTASTFICNPEFKEIKKIYGTALPQSHKKRKFAMPPLCTFARCTGDRIFLFDQQKDTVMVFDSKGNQKSEIKFPHEKIMTDDAFKNKVNDSIKIHPTLRNAPPEFMKLIYTPDVLPVFRDCRVIGDRLYIQTYRQKGDLSEFLIIDFSGKVEKKLFLPGAGRLQIRINPGSTYAFYDGKYYYLVDNINEEQWELHLQKLN
jgi:hypothetical protein